MRHLLCLLLLSVASSLHAQDKKPGDVMIDKYLAAEADKLSAKYLDGAKTIDEWKAKRPRLHREYLDMLGLWPVPEKTPLHATKTGENEAHGVVVENVHFQSKPGLYVTANVYRPKHITTKLPAIVYVCGHSGKGRDGVKTAFQDHGFWFANHGYVCIILDTLQLGEIPGVHHGTYGRPWGHLKSWGVDDAEKMKNHNRFWWHSIGYSPAAVECWNGVRAIDYLCTRPDVDPDRIGVTGISGGGAATFWIAAADDRVKVAVPVSGMSDLEFYIKNKGINGHCDCMFLHNTYQWDWTTIAAMIAPRPLLFANSDNDPIFPMDANRRIFAKLQTIYGMYGAEKSVQEYVSKGGHDYRPDLRRAIFHFFNVHLKRSPTALVEDSAKYTPLEGGKLRVFPTDQDLPKDAINHRIDETFITPAKVALPEKGKFAEWKKETVEKLRQTSFRGLPLEVPAGKYEKVSSNAEGKNEWELNMVTEPGIALQAGPVRKTGDIRILEIEDVNNSNNRALKDLSAGKNFWYLAPRVWHIVNKSPPNYMQRAQVLLGQTSDLGQVRDIIATFKYLHSHERATPIVIGAGDAGVLAAYAALLEPSIKEVVVVNPPKSHREGPHFLNVLRVLDIPEALGLLAPTPLTIIGGQDPAFDRTAEIYRLAGASDKLKRK
jgi:cephalosporin-C deacetylase-like acetyl esterase